MVKATIIKVFDFGKMDSKTREEIAEFLEFLLELDVPVRFDGDKTKLVVSDKLLSDEKVAELTESDADIDKSINEDDLFDFRDDDDDSDFLNWTQF